ncbi:MAG: UDP-N-acetylmuramoyl-tripeptide--D-alanyl-D-alanine ligase, partial [Acidobacteriota bacterium]
VSLLGRPDIAVYTNVRPVHLENFQSLRHIAEAKAELLAGVADDGTMIANADDAEVMRIAERFRDERGGRLVTYATQQAADVTASDPKPLANGEFRVGSRFTLHAAGTTRVIELPLHGLYNIENFLAAAACALTVAMDEGLAVDQALDDIVAGAAELVPSSMRGEVHRTAHGPTLIDDSYNSNPDAAARALESARLLPATRRVAILGDMLELGPDAAEYHRRVGKRAAELGFDLVVAVGRLAKHLEPGVVDAGGRALWLEDADAVIAWLAESPRLGERPLGRGDLVLVKGSRGVGLDAVVRALLDRYDDAPTTAATAGKEA